MRQDATLTRLVRQGLLTRVARGLYALPDRPVSEHTALAEVACKHPQAIVCLLSALSFHESTTLSPLEVWLAIPNKARAPRIDYPPLHIVRFSGSLLVEGVEAHSIDGMDELWQVAKLERLLYRLSVSAHAGHFLLKGALLFDLWFDIPHRPTRDADLLVSGSRLASPTAA